MEHDLERTLREQLVDRRRRIAGYLQEGQATDLVRLLRDVDAALERLAARRYGTCEVCDEAIDDELLLAHPLIPWCLCALSPTQQDELQRDLDLASRIQRALLPTPGFATDGWSTHYRYLAAGPVSGDYCDVVAAPGAPGRLDFVLGDVMGHGVAASLLTARLNALFRSLVELDVSLAELMARLNRLFRDRASAGHFATVVCGRTRDGGAVELCSAGHCAPFAVRRDGVERVGVAGALPVGITAAATFVGHDVHLAPGETLFLFTDGLVEARNAAGEQFGEARLAASLQHLRRSSPPAIAAGCLADALAFRAERPLEDDVTVLALHREHPTRSP